METSVEVLAELALTVVREAAELALHPDQELQVSTKANRNDLVTIVDKQIENFVAERLSAHTDYPMLGEEGHQVDSFQGRVWVLDPIDGTMNYVATHRDYAISLALCEDGEPILSVVANVVAGKYYTAIKGQGAYCNGERLTPVDPEVPYTDAIIITDIKEIVALPRLQRALVESRGHRRYGSAALECVEVACGQAGAFVHMWVSPWDIAGAKLICEEAGVVFTRLDGTPLDVRYKGSILAAWPGVHRSLLQRLMVEANG